MWTLFGLLTLYELRFPVNPVVFVFLIINIWIKNCGLIIKGPHFGIFTFLKDVFHPLKIILILANSTNKLVSMIRKYHNHTLQTNLRYGEEKPHDIYSNKTLESNKSRVTSLHILSKMIAKL